MMQLLQMETQNMSAAASARIAAKHSLKVLSRLYEQLGSYDDAVISLCVFGRGPDASEGSASRCNVSAISRLTGIPRETVRRRTKSLSDAGVLMLDGKTYRIAPAFTELLASVCDALTKPAATKSS
jgi:DNA-binding transcriptional ArsR family regulator